MHLLVLSAFRPDVSEVKTYQTQSQCTFWCSVLSDRKPLIRIRIDPPVSMHLLVLSAFRQVAHQVFDGEVTIPSQCTFWCSVLSDRKMSVVEWRVDSSLNAPSGAQCFPTGGVTFASSLLKMSLNAPSGAQCFPTQNPTDNTQPRKVSMHLLVLSAFRLLPQKTAPQRRLLERNRRRHGKHHIESARTRPIKPHNREKPPQTTPAPPTPPTSRYATGFQRTQAKKPTPHDYATVNTATKATVDCPCADTTDRFSLTASLGPTAASRWLPRPGCPPHPVDRRDPTVRRFHVNRRPPLAQPRCTG